MKTDSFFRITQLGVCRQSQFQQFLLLNRLVTRVLSDSSLHYPEKSGGKATGFIERLLQHVQAASWFETRDSVSRVVHYWWIYRSNVRPSSPAAVCRWGLSTAGCRGSSSGTSGLPAGHSPHTCARAPGTCHRDCSPAWEERHCPWVFLLTLLSLPLVLPAPRLPNPIRAGERVQQSPRRAVRMPSPGPGPCSTHRPRAAAAAAAGAGAAAPWAAAGGGAGPVLGSGACRCEAQRRRAGYKRRLSAPSRVPRSRSPSPSCAVHLARREELPLEEPAGAGSCHSGSGAPCGHWGHTPRVGDGAASPLLHTVLLWQLYFLFELQHFLGNLI